MDILYLDNKSKNYSIEKITDINPSIYKLSINDNIIYLNEKEVIHFFNAINESIYTKKKVYIHIKNPINKNFLNLYSASYKDKIINIFKHTILSTKIIISPLIKFNNKYELEQVNIVKIEFRLSLNILLFRYSSVLLRTLYIDRNQYKRYFENFKYIS